MGITWFTEPCCSVPIANYQRRRRRQQQEEYASTTSTNVTLPYETMNILSSLGFYTEQGGEITKNDNNNDKDKDNDDKKNFIPHGFVTSLQSIGTAGLGIVGLNHNTNIGIGFILGRRRNGNNFLSNVSEDTMNDNRRRSSTNTKAMIRRPFCQWKSW